MQIVLLSGGSGKRLWPLSNNARSKQFLPLLDRGDGVMESMVQRVVRQLRESHLTPDITVATNASQQDIIINQLGDAVSVVTEPMRRDTFPAIALAVSYLKLEKGCDDNEVVVVMPCDPYTEQGYYDAIGRMVECVESGVADLILMGVTPTYPSEKYGYVVPIVDELDSSTYRMVSRFTEKPSVARAKELLEMGALWNGGVFAFRVGYMMNIVRKYIYSESFKDTHSRYIEFPKISFDYEVAERASSVAVVPFKGKWKDLGTWNTLSEEITQKYIGNVTCGDNNTDSLVVNELGLPIFCDGLKSMVVVCSPDGILVCDKEYSEGIKDKVDRLDNRPMYEERRWGTYKVLCNKQYSDGNRSLTKELILRAGCSISYQLHNHRDEVWTFVDGEGILVLDGISRRVRCGDVVHITKGEKHTVKAITQLQIIEVQLGPWLDEEDIERFPWKWTDDVL